MDSSPSDNDWISTHTRYSPHGDPPYSKPHMPSFRHDSAVAGSQQDVNEAHPLHNSAAFASSRSKNVLSKEAWEVFAEKAAAEEKEFIGAWSVRMDMLLLFAALFSAVITAFVIISYPMLQADPTSPTVQVLEQILAVLQSNGTVSGFPNSTSTTFQPPTYAVVINALWFASLVISISTAFVAILAKEWLSYLGKDLHQDVAERGRQYQYRYGNLRAWYFEPVLLYLPLLLHGSLFLFLAGLEVFLWNINSTVAIVTTVFCVVAVLAYLVSHIVSVLDSTCPFRTSVTALIMSFLGIPVEYGCWLIGFVGASIIRVLALCFWHFTHDKPDITNAQYAEIAHKLFDPVRWGKICKSTIARFFADIGPRDSEADEIKPIRESLDANALARFLKTLPWSDNSLEIVARELSRFPHLLKYRDLFLDSDAISVLAHHIQEVHDRPFQQLSETHQDQVLHETYALARLLTEVVEDDPRSIIRISGIPVHFDISNAIYNDQEEDLIQSNFAIPDSAINDTDNLVLFANMLRIGLWVSTDWWYWRDIRGSLVDFHRRIEEGHELDSLSLDNLEAIVNTTIYASLCPVEPTIPQRYSGIRWNDWEREHADRTLDILAATMLRRPDMSFVARRRICWAIYVLSHTEAYFGLGRLIPVMKSVASVCSPLASLLSVYGQRQSVVYTILVMLEGLLFSGPPQPPTPTDLGNGWSKLEQSESIEEADQDDYRQLVETLAKKYSAFLEELLVMLRDQPPDSASILRLTRRIVRISGFLFLSARSQDMDDDPRGNSVAPIDGPSLLLPQIDAEYILYRTLDILRYICEGLQSSDPGSDEERLVHLAFATACQYYALQTQQNDTVPNNGTEATVRCDLDGMRVEEIADTLVVTLESFAQIPPYTLRTLLDILAASAHHSPFRDHPAACIAIHARLVALRDAVHDPVLDVSIARALSSVSPVTLT